MVISVTVDMVGIGWFVVDELMSDGYDGWARRRWRGFEVVVGVEKYFWVYL